MEKERFVFCSNKDNFSFEEFTAVVQRSLHYSQVSGIETLYPEVTLSSIHELLVGTFTLGHCHKNDTWPRLWGLGCHVPQTSTFVSQTRDFICRQLISDGARLAPPVSGSHHLFACWRHLHIDWTVQEHDAAEAPRPPRHPHQFLSKPGQAWHQLIYQRLAAIMVRRFTNVFPRSPWLFLMASCRHIFHRPHHCHGVHPCICYR